MTSFKMANEISQKSRDTSSVKIALEEALEKMCLLYMDTINNLYKIRLSAQSNVIFVAIVRVIPRLTQRGLNKMV